MTKIVILNVGIEHTMGQVAAPDWLARSAMRQTWFADEGDVVVSPLPLPEGAAEYLTETLAFASDGLTVLSCGEVVSDEVLLSSDVGTRLRDALAGRRVTELVACFTTPGVVALTRELGLPQRPGLDFAAQRGGDLIGRKSHFRQLLAGAGLPLVAGCVVEDRARLHHALTELMPMTGSAIVKRDDGAGGGGNVILTTDPQEWLPGAVRTQRMALDDAGSVAARLWDELADWWSPTLVVESYLHARHRFYFEFDIVGSAAHVVLHHSGTIRSAPDGAHRAPGLIGIGLDLPAVLPAAAGATALSRCAEVASLLGRVGYRGVVNIDGVISEDGEVICHEANARWGGGSVLHSIARRLLGRDYAEEFALSSVRELPAAPLPEVLDRLRSSGLAFARSTGEGVLVLTCDPERSDTMECLVIGRGRARERELEADLFAALS